MTRLLAFVVLGLSLLPGPFQPATLCQTAPPADQGSPLFNRAVELHLQGKCNEALAKLKEAVARTPTSKHFLEYQTELTAQAAKEERDQHALLASKEVEQSIDSLADYLVKPAKTDAEKVRMIFRWITDRVTYDVDALRSGKPGDNSTAGVLKSRKCVCEGFANLFEALAKQAGLEAVKVGGYSKGASYTPGKKFERANHAWNAVKIDGQWQLVDCTWGAGDLINGKFERRFKEFHLFTPPAQLIYSHFPSDAKWQLLPSPASLDDFTRWPRVKSAIFDFGFPEKDVRARLADVNYRGFVETFRQPGPRITVRAAPLEQFLKDGSKHKFRIETASFQSLVIYSEGKGIPLTRTGNVWEGEVLAKKGVLGVGGKCVNSPKPEYTMILKYTVE